MSICMIFIFTCNLTFYLFFEIVSIHLSFILKINTFRKCIVCIQFWGCTSNISSVNQNPDQYLMRDKLAFITFDNRNVPT